MNQNQGIIQLFKIIEILIKWVLLDDFHSMLLQDLDNLTIINSIGFFLGGGGAFGASCKIEILSNLEACKAFLLDKINLFTQSDFYFVVFAAANEST